MPRKVKPLLVVVDLILQRSKNVDITLHKCFIKKLINNSILSCIIIFTTFYNLKHKNILYT